VDTSAIIMLLIGAVFLWGGVAAVTVNYVLAARREPPG